MQQSEKPMSFFSENVDKWGAAEWFDRLAKAIRAQDNAAMAEDDIAFETYRMIAASSAITLVRDHEATVRASLTQSDPTPLPAPVDGIPKGWKLVPEEVTADMREALMYVRQELGSTLGDNAGAIYSALIDAAPQPPASPLPSGTVGELVGMKTAKQRDKASTDELKRLIGDSPPTPVVDAAREGEELADGPSTGYHMGYEKGLKDGLSKLGDQIAALKLHPTTGIEYDAGYIAARNDAFAIVQEAADNADAMLDVNRMRATLEWIEDYALAFPDLEEVAKRAGLAILPSQVSYPPSEPAPQVVDNRHEFVPNKKYPWFCAHCGYAPHEPLKHIQPTLSTDADGKEG